MINKSKILIFLSFILFVSASKKENVIFNKHLKININKIRKVAVIPKEKNQIDLITAAVWETDLINLGFKVLDRGNINSILKEHKLSLTGLFNTKDTYKIGELLGVDAILIIDEPITIKKNSYKSSGRVHMVNASNGRIIFTATIEERGLTRINLAHVLEPALEKLKWKHFYKKLTNYKWEFKPIFAKSPYFKQNSIKKIALSTNIEQDLIGPLFTIGYDVIEREALKNILNEQKLSLTGLLSPKEMKKIGNIYGIDGIVFAEEYRYGSTSSICFIKLVHLETGFIAWALSNCSSFKRDYGKFLEKSLIEE